MAKNVERQCPVCGTVYYAEAHRLKLGRQTTCSRECSYRARAAAQSESQQYQCGCCGKVVLKSPSQVKRAHHGEVFCSRACAYKCRKRTVEKPYVLVAVRDRTADSLKAWATRRLRDKPYPDAAREKARARQTARLNGGFQVSAYEREAAKVFASMGVACEPGVIARSGNGRFAAVFDLAIPARRLLVECHGTYWHGGRWTWDDPDGTQARNLTYEERKVAFAKVAGWNLRVLWEHDFRKDPRGACLAVLR